MKIAIYSRTSTDKQTCENQLILLEEIAQKNNDEVVWFMKKLQVQFHQKEVY